MRRSVVISFLVSFSLLSTALVVGANKLKPEAHFKVGSVDKTLLSAATGTGCVNCHTGTGVTAAFTAPASTVGITATQLYPGETVNLTIRATKATAATSSNFMGTNIAATGGTLSESEAALVLTLGTDTALGLQIQHSNTAGPLKVVPAGGSNFYAFSYTLTNATVPATSSIAGVAVVDLTGAGQHTSIAVTSRRPADTSGLTAGTPTSNSIPLTWSGTGPAYRVIAKAGATFPTGPTDTAGAVLNDVSTASDTVGSLTASTTYSIGVWGRASFSGIDTYSTNSSQTSAATAAVVPTTYYVNVSTGTDAGPGRSPTSPFKYITSAMGVAVSGDTINVAPGTYPWALPPC